MTTIAVVDYGMGNLHSVCRALAHVGPKWRVQLTSSKKDLLQADRIVFPGQGAIGGCIKALHDVGLWQTIVDLSKQKPLLGICLGLQVLYESSEEAGDVQGLGILPGKTRLFPREKMIDKKNNTLLKVPHMGWNRVQQKKVHPLWRDIPQDGWFYFVHSYYADSTDEDVIAAKTEYGVSFTSAAAHENIFAVQFHPEKSQKNGLQLLENFLNWKI